MKYLVRFWFDFGGYCLWGMNEAAKERFGYAIDINCFDFSDMTKSKLKKLQDEYGTYLDITDPLAPSPWSEDKKRSFLNQSKLLLEDMQKELSSEYELVFDVEKNMRN